MELLERSKDALMKVSGYSDLKTYMNVIAKKHLSCAHLCRYTQYLAHVLGKM